MRKTCILLLFTLGLGSVTTAHADTPACGQVIEDYINNGLYDILHITKTSSLQQDFAAYFFSQDFQNTYRNNQNNLSVTDGSPGMAVRPESGAFSEAGRRLGRGLTGCFVIRCVSG